MRRTLRLAGRGISVVVLAVAGVSLILGVVVPRVAGATPYTVVAGSMRPTLDVGTLVVSRPLPASTISIGDVVTYQLRSGEPELATHRVVGLGTTVGGERVFVTQGDANAVPDPQPVRAVQVRGVLWYAVPWLGHVSALASGQQREVAGRVIAVLLLGYAGWLVAGEVRERRARRHEGTGGTGAVARGTPTTGGT